MVHRSVRHFRLIVSAMLACISTPGAAQIRDGATARAMIDHVLDRDYPRLDALYKALHAQPELAFREVKTAGRLASEMRALGFTVTERVGGTGLVALYRNGLGPIVMARTELDALPMEEKSGLAYASRAMAIYDEAQTFVAHSCGHDLHMAIWVGTARMMVARKATWRGTLMFVAQPAEETTGGAKAMIADGLFRRFPKPDLGFALHSGPNAAGTVAYKFGTMSSSSASFVITFLGKGGHGSAPSATIDPVLMAGRFIVDVQSVDRPRSRRRRSAS